MVIFPKCTLLILASFSCFMLQAQEPFKIKWSGPNKMQRNDHHHKVVHADSTSIYCLSHHKNEKDLFDKGTPILDAFDWNLQRVSSRVLAGFEKTDSIAFQSLLNVAGYTYLFYYKKLERSQNVFLARRLNLKENRFEGEPVVIGDTMRIVRHTLRFFPWAFSGGIYGLQSMSANYVVNGDKIAFLFFKNLQEFRIAVYNRKMKLLWHKIYQLPFDERGTSLSRFALLRTGNVMLEFRQYEKMIINDWENRMPQDKFKHFLMLINGSNEEANLFQLDVGKPFYGDLVGREHQNGQIHYLTTYSEKEYNQAYGLIRYVVDPLAKTMTVSDPMPFSAEFVREVAPAPEKDHPVSLRNFMLRNENLTGDFGVVGEFFSEEGTGSLGNFAIIRYDSAFQKLQGAKIFKWQPYDPYQNLSEYFSGSLLNTEGASYLFYNKDFSKSNPRVFVSKWGKSGPPDIYPLAPPDDSKAMYKINTRFLYKGKYLVMADSERHDQYYLGVFEPD